MKVNPKKILQSLKINDALYEKKASILVKLMKEPDAGHILNGKLVKWADKVGIETKLHCEDKTSWWSCRI